MQQINLQPYVTTIITAFAAPLYALALLGMSVTAIRAIRDGVPFYQPMLAILALGFLLELRCHLVTWACRTT